MASAKKGASGWSGQRVGKGVGGGEPARCNIGHGERPGGHERAGRGGRCSERVEWVVLTFWGVGSKTVQTSERGHANGHGGGGHGGGGVKSLGLDLSRKEINKIT